MKTIYEFTITKEVEKEVKEETDNGTLSKKVKEEVPVKIIFKQPTRSESEDADMTYAVEHARCVRAGLLTRQLVEKLHEGTDTGILADDYRTRYTELAKRYFEVQNEFTELNSREEKTDDDKQHLEDLAGQFAMIRRDLQELEASRNEMFQHTAETKAQNKTILWLALYLAYMEYNGKPIPFFRGNTFEEKLASYDKMLDKNDPFEMRVVDKMALYVALWYLGRASTQEDFIKIDEDLNSGGVPQSTQESQPESEVPVPAEQPVESDEEKVEETVAA